MEKVKIIIIGERVHEVGYRVFLLNNALNFGIDRFNSYNAKENGMPAVIVLLEADEEIIADFYDFINKIFPEDAKVSEIKKEGFKGRVTNIEQYMHLAMVEQLDKGIPAIIDIKDNTENIMTHTEKILEHTSHIPLMREDIAEMKKDISESKSHTSYIPEMREDTASIRYDTKEIATKLWQKYEELSKEIAQMKITLSKIEAKVFS